MSARAERLIIAEFITAVSTEWRAASPSLQCEALSMLRALVRDAATCVDSADSLTVLACSEAREKLGVPARYDEARDLAELLSKVTQWAAGTNGEANPAVTPVRREAPESSSGELRRSSGDESAQVVLMAPETDRVLSQSVEKLSQVPGLRLISASSEVVACGSSRVRTAELLAECRVAQPRCYVVSPDRIVELQREAERHSVGELESVSVSSPGRPGESVRAHDAGIWMLKRDDGVGGEGMVRFQYSERELRSFVVDSSVPCSNGEAVPWVVQSWETGTPASIAWIGRGPGRTAQVLPPVRQQIRWTRGGSPVFCGGIVNGFVENPAADHAIRRVGAILSEIFPLEYGYCGADLVVTSTGVLVLEVNPRLCSSYHGYAAACRSHFLSALVSPADAPILFSPEPAEFVVN